MSNQLVVIDEKDRNVVELVKMQIARGATDIELRYFVNVCNRMGLDPFARQIWAIKRWDSSINNFAMGIQVGIDGFRHTANRTGLYGGQIGPFWCGQDGVWKDVWLSDEPPFAAKVGIIRNDFKEPIFAIAKYSAMVQLTKEKKPNAFWAKMPDHMLAKCAEAQAIRKCFGSEFVGVYSEDETAMAPEPELASPGPGSERKFKNHVESMKDVSPSKEEEEKHETCLDAVASPIVNHALPTSCDVDAYKTNFALDNFKVGQSFADLGVSGTKALQTLVMSYCLRIDAKGAKIPTQLSNFIDLSKIYLERFMK